jgi:CHRD domain
VRRTTRVVLAGVIAVLLVAAGVTAAGATRGGDDEFEARLKGFEEVPSVSTVASGRFEAEVSGSGASTRIDYELSYRGLESNSRFAHIHFGQRGVNGNVTTFLCGGGTKPTPCPLREGTVEGTIVASDIGAGAAAQGIGAGEIQELVRAMEAGVTYANVHTDTFGGGEIRGQLREDD